MNTKAAKDIDGYIRGYPVATQRLLRQMRATIRKAAPGATEKISYGIPAFALGKNLVHFAGYAKHIGFYPGAGAITTFEKELAGCETSKGTVQFPLDKPLPLGLVARIVKFRVQQVTKTKKK